MNDSERRHEAARKASKRSLFLLYGSLAVQYAGSAAVLLLAFAAYLFACVVVWKWRGPIGSSGHLALGGIGALASVLIPPLIESCYRWLGQRLRLRGLLVSVLRFGVVESGRPVPGIVECAPLWLLPDLARNELREIRAHFRADPLEVDLYRLEMADLLRRVETGSDVLDCGPKPWRLRQSSSVAALTRHHCSTN